jgi:mRNA interferase RelE/StbE
VAPSVNCASSIVAETDDPRLRGKGLSGPLAGLWPYRVGDHRIICQLLDDRLIVLVIRFGHRRCMSEKHQERSAAAASQEAEP